MRLKLTLQPNRRSATAIPINYNYYISSWIYQTIQKSSPEFSKFLHDKGYSPDTVSRKFKHFTFSRLTIGKQKVAGRTIQIQAGPVGLQISFLIDEALQHFVVGLFEGQKMWIAKEENEFRVEQVETLPEPEWPAFARALTGENKTTDVETHFQLLSPLTVSTVEERNGDKHIHYYRPDEPGFPEAIRKNAVNKFSSLNQDAGWNARQNEVGHAIPTAVKFKWDENYINKKGGFEKISKLVTIREGRSDETRIKCFMAPFSLRGDSDLIKLLYHSGIGEHNSQGFGMMETVQ